MITISEEEYRNLKDCERFIDCLRAVGVDNWEGFSEALNLFQGDDND